MASSPSILAREAGTSVTQARKRRKRPSLSHLLIAFAVVLSFGLNYLALQARNQVVQVAVATAPLIMGSPFDAGRVRLSEVPADVDGVDSLVASSDLTGVDGWILTRSLPAGALVDRASLAPPASIGGARLMSIPIAEEHAAGASISAGDRIDVISVVDGEAKFVASDLSVIAVPPRDQGALSAGGGFYVVVAVDPDEALGLALAIDQGSVEILRSTGATPIGEER